MYKTQKLSQQPVLWKCNKIKSKSYQLLCDRFSSIYWWVSFILSQFRFNIMHLILFLNITFCVCVCVCIDVNEQCPISSVYYFRIYQRLNAIIIIISIFCQVNEQFREKLISYSLLRWLYSFSLPVSSVCSISFRFIQFFSCFTLSSNGYPVDLSKTYPNNIILFVQLRQSTHNFLFSPN